MLLYQRSDDQGATWSTPNRLAARGAPAHSPHRGADPQIAASGRNLAAVWMTGGTGYLGSGPMATALSSDGGKTWRTGPNPADDKLTTGHGFTDIAADQDGVFHLAWLDGRDGRQGLRYARSLDGGATWTRNLTLKQETCECCWNTLTTDAAGTVHVLFRDKAPRDMMVASSLDGGVSWGKPVVVGRFDWEFKGCPHVGGSLVLGKAAGGRELHTLVWSGITNATGLYHLHSLDRGRTWSKPQRVGDRDARRGDIATGTDGTLAAVWETLSDEQMVIQSALSPDGGASWLAPVQLSETSASAAYPRVVAIEGGFRVFWTEVLDGTSSIWRTAGLPVTAKPTRRRNPNSTP